MYKCKKCGSVDVEILVIININTMTMDKSLPSRLLENSTKQRCVECGNTEIERVCEQCEQNPCICDKLYSPNAG